MADQVENPEDRFSHNEAHIGSGMSYLRIFVGDVFALSCALTVIGFRKLACVRMRKVKIAAKV